MHYTGLVPKTLWRFVVGIAAFLPVAGAQTQDCPGPSERGPIEVTPAFGSRAVAQNSLVRVLYTPGFFELPGAATPEASVTVLRCPTSGSCAVDGTVVPGATALVGDTVVVTPDNLLDAGTDYLVLAGGIDQSFEAPFRVLAPGGTSTVDVEAPRFGPVTSFFSTPLGESCEAPDGGFRVDVAVQPASNEPAGADVEYLLFLTRGVGIEAPEFRARARGVPGDVVMAFVLSPEESAQTICFTIQAIDGAGNLGELSEPVCEDPIQGNFFEPLCSVSVGLAQTRRADRLGAAWAWPSGLAIALAFLWVRQRRRRAVTC